ncbi:MAG TPA: hypothetical protein DCQ06_05480, partial [Myxococcales bacterium]|nr:hypothetical protein [Myxococcales bacterium]
RKILEPRGRKYPTVWIAGKRVRQAVSKRKQGTKPDKSGLRSVLRNYRRSEARKRRVRPYQVFTNAVIDAVVERRPTTMADLSQLAGIGPARLAKYGQALLDAVAANPAKETP